MIKRSALFAILIISFASGARAQETPDPSIFTFSASDLNPMLSPAPPPAPQSKPAAIETSTPPIPKRRPQTFHASKAFIQQARYQAPPAVAVPPPAVEGNPLDELTVKVLSANDILASLEGKKIEKTATKAPHTDLIQISFEKGETQIPYTMQEKLYEETIPHLKKYPDPRIEIHAFSSKHGFNGENGARHIALARALELKKFLGKNNVDEQRINIFSHGFDAQSKEHDVVNIVLN